MKIKDCSAIILSGGRCSRMGYDKAFADLGVGGITLMEEILKKLKTLFIEIIIVTNSQADYKNFKGVKIIGDVETVKGKGPLAGIYSGLNAITNNKAFVIACDIPLFNTQEIRQMLKMYEADDFAVLFTRYLTQTEPLFAVYHKNLLPTIEDMLNKNQLKVRDLANYVKAGFFPLKTKNFFNINTTEELTVLQKKKKFN